MERSEKALLLRKKGYNCAQAVICSFADVLELPEEELFAICEGFGVGMGDMSSVCGAVVGAVMAAGYKNSSRNLEHPDSGASTLKLSRTITKSFIEQNHSMICKELKGVETGVVLRECTDCIQDAVKIAERVLLQGEETKPRSGLDC